MTIQETLKLNPEDLDKAEHVQQKKLLLWYYDRGWLPVVAGKHFWRDEIRYFKLLTDTQDVAGKQKVNCTVTSKAFGLLNYENYKRLKGALAVIDVDGCITADEGTSTL